MPRTYKVTVKLFGWLLQSGVFAADSKETACDAALAHFRALAEKHGEPGLQIELWRYEDISTRGQFVLHP